jgi:hypothetical protein
MIASPFNILDRIVSAVNAVHERLQKSVAAIENAGIAYALTDDNAVAAWVAQADESAVRNTPDVTILIRRTDFNSAKRAMVHAGFEFYTEGNGNLFIDAPGSKRGTQLFFANELIHSKTSAMHPDLAESENVGSFRVLSIPAIGRTKPADNWPNS